MVKSFLRLAITITMGLGSFASIGHTQTDNLPVETELTELRGFKLSPLPSGRIKVESCLLTGLSDLTSCSEQSVCLTLGNAAGYDPSDFKFAGWANKAGAAITGTIGGFVVALSVITGTIVAAPEFGAITGVLFIALPSGVVVAAGKTIDWLNPFRQWRVGSLKEDFEEDIKNITYHAGTKHPAVFVPVDAKHYTRDLSIIQNLLKSLPSDRTTPNASR